MESNVLESCNRSVNIVYLINTNNDENDNKKYKNSIPFDKKLKNFHFDNEDEDIHKIDKIDSACKCAIV